MQILKPHIDSILYECSIPCVKLTHKDVNLFTEDATEFIRKQQDFTETLYMPRQTLVDLIESICMYDPTLAAAKHQKQMNPK
jgi:hypothetical protein